MIVHWSPTTCSHTLAVVNHLYPGPGPLDKLSWISAATVTHEFQMFQWYCNLNKSDFTFDVFTGAFAI